MPNMEGRDAIQTYPIERNTERRALDPALHARSSWCSRLEVVVWKHDVIETMTYTGWKGRRALNTTCCTLLTGGMENPPCMILCQPAWSWPS